jgi:hypothetical protein
MAEDPRGYGFLEQPTVVTKEVTTVRCNRLCRDIAQAIGQVANGAYLVDVRLDGPVATLVFDYEVKP